MGLTILKTNIPDSANTDTVLWFGRYRDHTVGDVLLEDPNYLVWANTNIDGFDLHWALLEEAEQDHLRNEWELFTPYHWQFN